MRVAVFSTKSYDRLFLESVNKRFGHELTFPNVIITGHQAFFTHEAMENIAETTLSNIKDFERGRKCPYEVSSKLIMK